MAVVQEGAKVAMPLTFWSIELDIGGRLTGLMARLTDDAPAMDLGGL